MQDVRAYIVLLSGFSRRANMIPHIGTENVYARIANPVNAPCDTPFVAVFATAQQPQRFSEQQRHLHVAGQSDHNRTYPFYITTYYCRLKPSTCADISDPGDECELQRVV
jgi:hypothetical protein